MGAQIKTNTETAPLNILLVDDSETCRLTLKFSLESFLPAASQILEAPNGAVALEILKRSTFPIHCVLLDVQMPPPSGPEMIEPIHSITPDTCIIMVTGSNDMQTALQCMQAGAEDYIVKSHFTAESLGRSVRYAFERKHARTERNKLQEALKREHELTEMQKHFIKLVSHEFRTPLSIISSASQLLRQIPSNNEALPLKRLNKIDRAVERLVNLMNDVTLLTKTESELFLGVPQNFNLRALVAQIEQNFKDSLGTNRITYHGDALPECIYGNVILTEHTLSNVIGNALKYSGPESQVEVLVAQRLNALELLIQDSGAGMNMDDLAQAGDKFFRAQHTQHIAGTGVGLYLAQQFMKIMGGALYICSEEGKGTTVKLVFPMQETSTTSIAA